MWVLGIAGSHNSGAALIHDGRVAVAVQTERLTRVKRHAIQLSRMTSETAAVIEYCLGAAGIDLSDVDAIATCSPFETRAAFAFDGPPPPAGSLPPFVAVPHHLAHAEYAIHYAREEDALVVVSDGSGTYEDLRGELDLTEERAEPVEHLSRGGKESLSAYRYDGERLRLVHRIAHGPLARQPDGDVFTTPYGQLILSLGHLWQWAAYYCHGSISEAGKVMGLAPFGDAAVHGDLRTVRLTGDADLELDFDALFDRFDRPNTAAADVTGDGHYADLAAHVQAETNAFVASLFGWLRARHDVDVIHYTGGVALNGITNEHVARSLGVELGLAGSCEDNGTAIGAALAVHHARTGRRVVEPLDDFYGRDYTDAEIVAAIARSGRSAVRLPWPEIVGTTVEALVTGHVVGWFQGRSEFGPRALGHRSILADPRRADMQDVLNSRVKHREAFRPFAPAVIEARAAEHFDLDGPSPMMLRVVPVRGGALPAVTHVDASARVQTVSPEQDPGFHDLLCAFGRRTGVPVLLNTSFNVAGEPIVESPDDAVRALDTTGLDLLVIGDHVVR